MRSRNTWATRRAPSSRCMRTSSAKVSAATGWGVWLPPRRSARRRDTGRGPSLGRWPPRFPASRDKLSLTRDFQRRRRDLNPWTPYGVSTLAGWCTRPDYATSPLARPTARTGSSYLTERLTDEPLRRLGWAGGRLGWFSPPRLELLMSSAGSSARPTRSERGEAAREKAREFREMQKRRNRRNKLLTRGGIIVAAVAVCALVLAIVLT